MGTGPTLVLWWPLFLAMKFTFLFLNLAKIHIFIPKCTEGGWGGSTGLGNIPKNTIFFTASQTHFAETAATFF